MNPFIDEMRHFISQRKENFQLAVKRQTAVWKAEAPDSQPLLLSCAPDKQWLDTIPDYNSKEIHFDTEKMITGGFKFMLSSANGGREAVPSIRAHMGCGIFPTLFGLTQTLFDDKLPWMLEHLTKETIMHMGPEDLKPGDEFKAGLEHMAKMRELVEGTGAYVFPLDLQSPFGTAHLVYGDKLFYDLYDDPGFIHHLLDLSCECLIFGITECLKVMNGSDTLIAHYNNLIIPREMGGLKISEDTATLISKDAIEEFVLPYQRKLLRHFGGGYVHYCGKNDRLLDALLDEPLVHGINFGNTEKHDMDAVLRRIAGAGKLYFGGINMLPEETHYDFFLRVLKASRQGDLYKLLLQISAPDETKRDEMISDWEKAQAALRRRQA